MGHTSLVLASLLATLGGFALLLARGNRCGPATRHALLVGLWLCAAVAHTHSLTRDSVSDGVRLTVPAFHLHEFLHYYLGSKYYAEIGHGLLYEAIVIADFEDDRANFVPRDRIRDLQTNRVDRSREQVLRQGALARQRFDPARWDDFKADVGLLRDGYVSRAAWHRSAILRDHGYNGSPLTTLLLGTVANQPFVSTLVFFHTMRWMDLVLVGLLGCLVGARLGAGPALAFGVLWLANPLNDYGFVGGSFLRYNFALALILAWLALDRDQPRRAGAWLAVATHLRIFPGLFALGLLLHDLTRPGAEARRQALRRNRPLYATFAATGAALAAVTVFVPTPEGKSVWLEFRDRITVHAQALAFNSVGLGVPFGYSEQQSVAARREALADGRTGAWEDIVESTLEDRRAARGVATALLLAATLLCARRLPRRYALFLGFALLFTLMDSSHYYYLSLGLLALVFHDHRAVLLALTTGFGAIALTALPTGLGDDLLRMGVASAATAATLAAIGAIAARDEPSPPPWTPA